MLQNQGRYTWISGSNGIGRGETQTSLFILYKLRYSQISGSTYLQPGDWTQAKAKYTSPHSIA